MISEWTATENELEALVLEYYSMGIKAVRTLESKRSNKIVCIKYLLQNVVIITKNWQLKK